MAKVVFFCPKACPASIVLSKKRPINLPTANKGEKKGGGIGVNDIFHGGSCYDGERESPKVKTKIAHTHNPIVKRSQYAPMLCEVSYYHRGNQNKTNTVENNEERLDETNVHIGFYQRKTSGNEGCTDEIG